MLNDAKVPVENQSLPMLQVESLHTQISYEAEHSMISYDRPQP
jgi:hypothetical protein